ncbi:tRNA dihydrouridine synthase DusB [Sutterella sp.]|uniref:tRNA dihydrouridine synthase DusB n=1 Tax=Sutterella sp. TaxID=1981025 RepID=UPI0026DFB712|nr:tRNA dihydrouridine synthase DusB [Sutterella sp.]MDO5531017.1 tRNA dihydrouridine synthase DusB [Sutterella sp.]
MKIGAHQLPDPALMLAPMAGFTDLPFRELCRSWGADYAVAEMTASRADLRDREKSLTRWVEPGESGIKVVQLLGADPAVMAEAAAAAEADGADVIDINMGCPAKKVLHAECGSALMRDEGLVREILTAVTGAVTIPVTLKIRTGWERAHRNAPAVARIAEESGIAMLAIHGRTREDAFRGEAEYETIAAVKRFSSIPVVANGDITCPAKALRVLELTRADGLMIGRGAVGRPWIFAAVRAAIEGKPFSEPGPGELLRVILDHRARHFDYYDGRRAVRTFRKHLAAYLRPLAGSEEALPALLAEEDPERQIAMVRAFLERARAFSEPSSSPDPE